MSVFAPERRAAALGTAACMLRTPTPLSTTDRKAGWQALRTEQQGTTMLMNTHKWHAEPVQPQCPTPVAAQLPTLHNMCSHVRESRTGGHDVMADEEHIRRREWQQEQEAVGQHVGLPPHACSSSSAATFGSTSQYAPAGGSCGLRQHKLKGFHLGEPALATGPLRVPKITLHSGSAPRQVQASWAQACRPLSSCWPHTGKRGRVAGMRGRTVDICSVRFSAGVFTASTTMGQCHSCCTASVAVTRPWKNDAAHAPSMPLHTGLKLRLDRCSANQVDMPKQGG